MSGERSLIKTDAQFIELWKRLGTCGIAREFRLSERAVRDRRNRIEKKLGVPLAQMREIASTWTSLDVYPETVKVEADNGIVLIASDAHYWPGKPTLMHKALVAFCKELKPKAVIFNGDVIDAPRISRHAPLNWEHGPQVHEEIESAQERLSEIEKATFKAQKVWTIGNHDARFESRLATVAPEYAKVHGVHLKDHFPNWQPAMLALINASVVVKHRFKGGIHATHNNTIWSGRSIVTGHLHSAKVTPFDDYDGTRYGVDSGCLADTNARQFAYTEGNPLNWRSAFAVLTFKGGRLLQPELVVKWNDETVQFRGEVIKP